MTLEEAIKNREKCLRYLEALEQKANPQNVEAVRWSVKALKFMQRSTLTPPNEPLTPEELREMEQSTPVWWDYIPCWVLVRRGSVLAFGSEPHKVENLFGYFYRRPPEGEADGE